MQAPYDGLGRCVRRTVGGTTLLFTYDDWNPILEWGPGGDWRAWNIYGAKPDEILARYDANHGPLIYKQDRQGSVTFLLNGSNQIIEKYTYDAYGRPAVSNADGSGARNWSNYGNRFMFTGREWLWELNLYDYRHRLYDPGIGRFLQTDPIGFDAGDLNLFRYCGDDPVNRTDPLGLDDDVYAERERLSIRATLKAAKAYRTNNPEGLGKAVWGAHRRDGTGYDEFSVTAAIREGYRRYGSIKRWEAYEIEKTPRVDRQKYDYWAYVGHVHGRKGEKNFSVHDGDRTHERVVVTRVDANDVDKGGNLKPGHSVKRAVASQDGKIESRDVYTQPASNTFSAPSAKDIDMAHQALGVPSLAAESVNFAPGAR